VFANRRSRQGAIVSDDEDDDFVLFDEEEEVDAKKPRRKSDADSDSDDVVLLDDGDEEELEEDEGDDEEDEEVEVEIDRKKRQKAKAPVRTKSVPAPALKRAKSARVPFSCAELLLANPAQISDWVQSLGLPAGAGVTELNRLLPKSQQFEENWHAVKLAKTNQYGNIDIRKVFLRVWCTCEETKQRTLRIRCEFRVHRPSQAFFRQAANGCLAMMVFDSAKRQGSLRRRLRRWWRCSCGFGSGCAGCFRCSSSCGGAVCVGSSPPTITRPQQSVEVVVQAGAELDEDDELLGRITCKIKVVI
jgi:hypothetical protein